ncbi:MAG: GNAT family N-acetyltransferase [Brevinema sp.]
MDFLLQTEQTMDSLAVGEVLVKAFNRFDEYNLVKTLREAPSFHPELAVVGLIDGKISGYALCTEIKVGDMAGLSLAPIAVLPEMQGRGLGEDLVREIIRRANFTDYPFILVLGKPALYKKCGFVEAMPLGINPPFDVPSEFYRIFNLKQHQIKGQVVYPDIFGL